MPRRTKTMLCAEAAYERAEIQALNRAHFRQTLDYQIRIADEAARIEARVESGEWTWVLGEKWIRVSDAADQTLCLLMPALTRDGGVRIVALPEKNVAVPETEQYLAASWEVYADARADQNRRERTCREERAAFNPGYLLTEKGMAALAERDARVGQAA